ncbi:MAG: 4-(cytidine 5'-diphospho)-2-C-methyl-D-erythritol kinase [candidate division WOR-3 bacterium]
MKVIRLHSPAKINLGLWVGRKRADGYHELVTIMVPLEFGDRIRLEKTGGGICVKTTGINLNIPERANLAYRAAGLFFTATGISGGCRIFIKKNIPPGGGLGGGSSNAATVLLGLNYLFDHPLNPAQLTRLARELGSDVPFFLQPKPCVARGRGEKLRPLTLPALRIVLYCPGFGISTRWAYERLDRHKKKLTTGRFCPKIIALKLRRKEPAGLAELIRNSFETVVFRRYPELAKIKKQLLESGMVAAGLTGSGSTVYGLQYATDPMAEWLHSGLPWIITRSRPSTLSGAGTISGIWGVV